MRAECQGQGQSCRELASKKGLVESTSMCLTRAALYVLTQMVHFTCSEMKNQVLDSPAFRNLTPLFG